MIYVICIYSCTTLWQVQSCLRAAARESKPGEIIDSKTMEKKTKEMKRGRGIGRGRGRGRGRGKGKGRGKGRGRKQPCQQNEEEDSDENPELKILEEEDMEIRRSLGMEEDFEKEDRVSGSMLWLHVFWGSILSHHVPLTRSAIPTSCKLRHLTTFFAVGMLLSSCEDNGQVPKEDQVIEEARSSKFLHGIRVVVPGITMACN